MKMVCKLATDRILHHVVASLFVIDLDVNVIYLEESTGNLSLNEKSSRDLSSLITKAE